MTLKSFFAVLTVLSLLFILSGVRGVQAQTDWLKKGQETLGNLGSSGDSSNSPSSLLSNADIIAGLTDALIVGTETVVRQLGRADGFNSDPAIHIPLPDSLKPVQSAMKMAGMSGMLDDLELKLNRAAETATPLAKDIFWKAIRAMTLEDARAIYNGPDDAATRYFQGNMTSPLTDAMQPIVANAMSQVGAVRAYDDVMAEYKSLPFVPDVKANLTRYVIEKALGGIFHYVAKEEAAIRNNPAKRSTDILQKVFSAR
ncbi:MAG: DUF4197 domain-containing protein [Rhodospirillales bacterium]|nr:DUF4197 domain-containing protein [Rhodospirillales bacterium]